MAALVTAASIFAPPPDLTISQWADAHRMLSAEGSAEQGRWDTDRAPYQREMMDVLTQPGVHEAVYMLASQMGKTELELNILGYFMHWSPCPVLIVYPTLDMGKAYSKTRLGPMIRDCPALRVKVKEARSRDSGNTMMMKSFPGGHLIIAGSNSPASLSSYPIRVVLCDEIDRFAESAGAEGDPVELAFQRTRNFWNALKIVVGTPTIKDFSAIEKRFKLSDQRYFYVPCPCCGHEQVLDWNNVIWDKNEDGHGYKQGSAVYGCPHCSETFDLDRHKQKMLRKGRWIAHNPASKIPGFAISTLYSPWVTLGTIVEEFLKKKALGPEGLKTFVNLFLAETWDPQKYGDINTEGLMARREVYGAQVPWGVGCLTASIDVQKDRLELKVKGWGRAGESWLIHYEKIPGSPALQDVWDRAEARFKQAWRHASGKPMWIEAMFVDTGDGNRTEAYEWAKPRIPIRIYPIKGQPGMGHPLVKKSSNKRIKLWHIGTMTAKDTILLTRIKIEAPGPGYMHFPKEDWCDADYFKGLATSERLKPTHNGRGRMWDKVTPDAPNEPLDLEGYAWAAFHHLNLKPDEMEARLVALEAYVPPEDPADEQTAPILAQRTVKPRRTNLSKGYTRR